MSDSNHRAGPISGWGRYPIVDGVEVLSEDLEQSTRDAVLTRGLGRSYGDASLPPPGRGPVAGSRLADRSIAFDETNGTLRVEAGFTLAQLNRSFLPRGFCSPVVPGTQLVTLGGMVAADIHGKNHHTAGTIGRHVRALRMRVGSGELLEVSEASQPELFLGTLGGMGLTGHILEVEIGLERIPSPWIWQETETFRDHDRLIGALIEAGRHWPYTVVWCDALARGASLGRGILIKGRWARPSEAPSGPPRPFGRLGVPFDPPGWTLNRPGLRVANELYYRRARRQRPRIVHPERFFHPLDALDGWNRLYGRRGFIQYQCVLPPESDGCPPLLELLARKGGASYLTVIKDFGDEGRGLISFPRPGLTVSLDIPAQGEATRQLVDALNDHVAERAGRIYLAKDALSRPEHFRAMEPRLSRFQSVRGRWDPQLRLGSAQSARLLGDEA